MDDIQPIIILVSIVVLMPIVPAALLFRYLPSEARATGPFKGLKIKLGGAFSGYFLVALMAGGFIMGYYERVIGASAQYELWTIRGTVEKEPGEPTATSVNPTLAIQPPLKPVYPSGIFRIHNVPVAKQGGVEELVLVVSQEGYQPQTISFAEGPSRVAINHDSLTAKVLTPIHLALKKEMSPLEERQTPKQVW